MSSAQGTKPKGAEKFSGVDRDGHEIRVLPNFCRYAVYLTGHKSIPARKKTQMFFFIPCKVINKDKSVKPLGGDLRSRIQEFDF